MVNSSCTISISISICTLSSFKFFKITLHFKFENPKFKIKISFWKRKSEIQKYIMEKDLETQNLKMYSRKEFLELRMCAGKENPKHKI